MAWVPASNDPVTKITAVANWGQGVVTSPSGVNPATYTSGFKVDPDYYVTPANQGLSVPVLSEGTTLVPALTTGAAGGMTQSSYPF
jgi:hypothetical protein